MNVKESIKSIVIGQYKLNIEGLHGRPHWDRVEKIGHFLSRTSGADPLVVSCFAYFHDSKREDESTDINHGKRAAGFITDLADILRGHLTLVQIEQLRFACYYHNTDEAPPNDDKTILTCWDADRLDLWRLGIRPKPERLCTEVAKSSLSIGFARCLNENAYIVKR